LRGIVEQENLDSKQAHFAHPKVQANLNGQSYCLTTAAKEQHPDQMPKAVQMHYNNLGTNGPSD
jgi:hypothetical protein